MWDLFLVAALMLAHGLIHRLLLLLLQKKTNTCIDDASVPDPDTYCFTPLGLRSAFNVGAWFQDQLQEN